MLTLWIAISWLSGSLMFSYWLGLMARHNLGTIGDGNPGGVNLYKAAGFRWGLTGIALDFLKGYLPVAILLGSGTIEGMAIVPIAAAPVLGHATTPFLKFKGGKAIAVTFGVWSALTQFEISLVYAVTLAVLLLIVRGIKGGSSSSRSDAAQILFGMLIVLGYMLARHFPRELLWCWLAIFSVLVYSHRREFRKE
ncbi:glycerol-3-phosphate acyltransferase [Cohnella lupini]|uniref:Acyl-phosphate glycerol 3-phosphate acyltransferase n=1 Tax=Cohnella lupini TaxID=1294267 RepID=A0A3D9I9P1_9BACL|nr:glycerol-3-phosphate acyltransferase [Cohnella lupini]RED58488.1 acyl-phosphate glycerol 3-phosphate acyltransferase [Cohnella lupini]